MLKNKNNNYYYGAYAVYAEWDVTRWWRRKIFHFMIIIIIVAIHIVFLVVADVKQKYFYCVWLYALLFFFCLSFIFVKFILFHLDGGKFCMVKSSEMKINKIKNRFVNFRRKISRMRFHQIRPCPLPNGHRMQM